MSIIYGLVDGNTMELRYVGQTIHPANRRREYKSARRNYNLHLSNWLRATRWNTIVLERDPSDLDEAEQRWIRLAREGGARLINIEDGGKSSRGYRLSAETRAKMSRAAMGNKYCVGRVLSTETRAKISQALMGNQSWKYRRRNRTKIH